MPSIRPISGKKVTPSKATDAKSRLLGGGQIEKGFLYVTNGELVMRFPVQDAKKITDGYVPREALLHIERDEINFTGTETEIRIGQTPSRWKTGKKGHIDGSPRTVYSRFEPVFDPNQPRQFPNLSNHWPEGREGMSSIVIDTKELRTLALAMGLNCVRIEFDPDDDDQRLLIEGRAERSAAVVTKPWRADV